MAQAQEAPRERILLAAIQCLEEDGVPGVTTRRIAARAGVNVAAINYYFGSKDALIDQALDATLENAFDWGDYRDSEAAGPHDRIVHVLDVLTQGAVAYPELSRTHLEEEPKAGGKPGRAAAALQSFLERLEEALAARGLLMDQRALRSRLLQAYASTVPAAVYMRPLLLSYAGTDLHDSTDRKQYIESVVTALFE